MTDRLAELGALQYAVENLSTAGTNPNRLGLAGYIHAAYIEYQTWAAANPGVNPNRLSARGRIYGYFYDNASWSPSSLFANSEVGAWYDPSDLSTMFQDISGSTQVTADGQPVGLILDKSKGLVLGPELVTNPGPFSNTIGWAGNQATLSVVDNKLRVTASLAGAFTQGHFNITGLVPGAYYKVVSTAISGTMPVSTASAYLNGPGSGSDGFVGLSSGVAGTYYQKADADGSVWFSIWGISTNIGDYFDILSMSVKKLPGNHATAPSNAARPLYKTDGTYHWLQFDGVDDSLSTAAIDFTGTDKMSVLSGIRKASDATQTVPISFGNISTTLGTFEINAPHVSTTQSYAAYFRGTGSYSFWDTLGFPALNKNVIAVTCDLSVTTGFGKDKVNLRINANDINETWSTSDAGTGSFSSSSLMLGARGLSPILLFNGNIYSIIVRGALSTTQEITDTETWVNSKTGAY